MVWAVQPAVTEAPPQGDSPGLMLSGLAIGLFIVTLIYWAFRRMRRRHHEGVRTTMGGASVGNALLEFNAIFQPDRPNVETIVRLEEEEEEQEAVLDGRDPERSPTPPPGSPFRGSDPPPPPD